MSRPNLYETDVVRFGHDDVALEEVGMMPPNDSGASGDERPRARAGTTQKPTYVAQAPDTSRSSQKRPKSTKKTFF